MLTFFTTYAGQSVAINTEHVILVTEVQGRDATKITLVDGGTTEVRGGILETVSQLNVAQR